MRIFINDISVKITDQSVLHTTFNTVVNKNAQKISVNDLNGKVLITTSDVDAIDRLLKIMTDKKYKNIESIVIQVDDRLKSLSYLKSKFNIIEAAGGVVRKGKKILFIFRRGVWDLPKGKLEKKEKKKHGAMREVEEETGVKVELEKKICATWHTYTHNKKFVLKKTYWYSMNCLGDENMQPQEEEDIQEVAWMSRSKAKQASNDTFASIAWVIRKYFNSNQI